MSCKQFIIKIKAAEKIHLIFVIVCFVYMGSINFLERVEFRLDDDDDDDVFI